MILVFAIAGPHDSRDEEIYDLAIKTLTRGALRLPPEGGAAKFRHLWTKPLLPALIALLFGYAAGSIPSGVVVTRLAGAEDPRGIGSKNIGATNVLRTGRKDLAAITLLADALKGTIAVLVAAHFDQATASVHLGIMAALGAFFGHLYPVFLGFKGGKGVATFLGCLVGLEWPAAVAFILVWLATAYLTRYSSAGALMASAATPLVLLGLDRKEAALLFAALAIVLWIKHGANIRRLTDGTESKIGQKKGAPAS